MIGTRRAGWSVFAAGLAVAAVAAGGAAAAMPIIVIPVQARLAPVAGASSAGRFSGMLVSNADGASPPTQALPVPGNRWRFGWKVRFPSLGSPAVVTLRFVARDGLPAVVRVLSAHCSTSARGTLTLSGRQAGRIARGDTAVTVRAGSARLRGTVKVRGKSG